MFVSCWISISNVLSSSIGNAVDKKAKAPTCLMSLLELYVTITDLNSCTQLPRMSSYDSILLSFISKDPPNWFATSLESVNNCTFVAPILNIVLSVKIVAPYSALLFEAGNPNLIVLFIVSPIWEMIIYPMPKPFLLCES